MIAQLDSLYVKTRPLKALSRLISYAFFEGRPLTTKGQWINPLVFGLFALEKRLKQLKSVEKPIFIIGTGRSGTTLLGRILSMHRDVGFLNEPKALWHSIYPDEDILGNYSSENTGKYRLYPEQVTDEVKRTAHRLFGAYLLMTASHRLVDKYPELIFRTSFVRTIFPDAKFIFLVRNGWDTCQSIENWSKRLSVKVNNNIHDWWGVNNRKWNVLIEQLVVQDSYFEPIINIIRNFDRHIDMAAIEWIVTMREGLNLCQSFPEMIYLLKYEELTSSPQTTLTQIFKFCELVQDDIVLNYANQILLPSKTKSSMVNLNKAIVPLFEETMIRCGYQ